MEFEEKVTNVENVFKGHVIELNVETVTLPDGRKATREIVRHQGAVGVIAITPEDKIVLIRQWRAPLGKVTLEIPAGKIELKEKQTPLQTALRELNEETGYQAQSLELLTEFYSSPGFADEKMYLYHAVGLSKAKEKLAQDDDEFLEIVELDLKQVNEAIARKEICDAKTLMAILFWKMME